MKNYLFVLLLSIVSSPLFAQEYTTYYVNDALGTPIAALNETGDIIWQKKHTPFGETHGNTDDKSNRIGFTGHVEEESFNLVYMQGRWYDPAIGRFYSIDPVGFKEANPMSFNRYAYANNNPYKFVDPDGRDSYLASRPLSFTKNGNHNFIVSNAKSLGDPNAKVSSFGDVGNDTMGQVTKDTKGFSEGTFNTDNAAWQSLSGVGSSTTFRKIDATDAAVDDLVSRVDKGLEYSLLPEVQGGVNSNTAAGAVAKKADGGSAKVNNGMHQPGSDVTSRIKFSDSKKEE